MDGKQELPMGKRGEGITAPIEATPLLTLFYGKYSFYLHNLLNLIKITNILFFLSKTRTAHR